MPAGAHQILSIAKATMPGKAAHACSAELYRRHCYQRCRGIRWLTHLRERQLLHGRFVPGGNSDIMPIASAAVCTNAQDPNKDTCVKDADCCSDATATRLCRPTADGRVKNCE
jgi:hypothetical protein